jgi:integrase
MKLGSVRKWPVEVPSGSFTVKIYRIMNKGRRSFMVSYFVGADRKQKMFVDFEDAYQEAKGVSEDVNNGETTDLNLSNSDRVIFSHASQAVAPTGVPLDLAAKEYATGWALTDGQVVEACREYARRKLHKVPAKLVPEAVKEMLEAKEKEGSSKAYMKALRVYLKKFETSFKSQLMSVTAGDVGDFLRQMGGSPRSRNNARQVLGAFYKFAKERGWVPRDHDVVGLVPKFKQKSGAIEIFTPWELVQFLNSVRDELVPFMAIGAFAGLRHAEIARLDWREVRLADRFIEVTAGKSKTASRRLVPITDNLVKWLKDHVQKEGRVVPFDNVNKQIGWLVRDTNKALKDEAKKAGKNPDKVGNLKWKKNALRHSFISYRLAEIQAAAQVALEAGNSPQIIFQHYRELVRPNDAKSWFSITPGDDGKILYIEVPNDGEQLSAAVAVA